MNNSLIVLLAFCRNNNIENSLDNYRKGFDIVYLVSVNILSLVKIEIYILFFLDRF